jgi:DNA repair exonuclease SbcCD ATPase subunit
MTPPTANSQLVEALQKQISQLGDTMQQALQRVESALDKVADRVSALETREAGCQPLINQKLDAAWRKIDEQESSRKILLADFEAHKTAIAKEVTELKLEIGKLKTRLDLTMAIGAAVGLACLGWLVSQILGLIK